MASEGIQSSHYIGKILPNGHLEIPQTVFEQMGLKDGDEVEVALSVATSVETEVSIPEETRALIKELAGTPRSLKEAVEALTFIATEMMPPKKQQRLSDLLWKNQDGIITAEEEKELDALVSEEQEGTIRKAKAILALKHLGIDIIPVRWEVFPMAKEKELELKGIVPWHKSLTKAERKRLMKKAIGGFKRAGLTYDDFKELLPDESE